MKSILLSVMLISILLFVSCKGNKSESSGEVAATSETGKKEAPSEKNTDAAPKTFTLTAAPDSVLLGKNQEALVKIKNLKAVQLSTPDDANAGIQISYDIEVTNRRKIGESSVYINPNNFRLVLDNGNKLTHDSYNSVSADADATASSSNNIFKLPAGTKPATLNLFFDDTQASVKFQMQ